MTDPRKDLSPLPDDAATRTAFTRLLVPMTELVGLLMTGGKASGLSGMTFTDCVIQGPVVLLPSRDTRFQNCNLGHAHGDVRNLFLQAAGPLVTGAVPVGACVFERCDFVGVGFAGDKVFVDHFVAELSGPTGGAA